MINKLLTVEDIQQVVERLFDLGQIKTKIPLHPAGPQYTSLMMCFLMHNMAAAAALLSLRKFFTNEWFPSSVGYVILRSMFETEITAHYISQSPIDRSRQYIDFEHILNKKEMDAYLKHRNSNIAHWRDNMNFMWRTRWEHREKDINSKYLAVYPSFETLTKKGKRVPFQNWSNKSIRQMAIEVDHEEAYDIFYAELSSFTHVDVRLANRFLRIDPNEMSWSQSAIELDVGKVFAYAASFLTCFLSLFAEQFGLWTKEDVRNCWNVK